MGLTDSPPSWGMYRIGESMFGPAYVVAACVVGEDSGRGHALQPGVSSAVPYVTSEPWS
jgi:hypothetical protein